MALPAWTAGIGGIIPYASVGGGDGMRRAFSLTDYCPSSCSQKKGIPHYPECPYQG